MSRDRSTNLIACSREKELVGQNECAVECTSGLTWLSADLCRNDIRIRLLTAHIPTPCFHMKRT